MTAVGMGAGGVDWDAGRSMDPQTPQKCEPAAAGPCPCGQMSGRAELSMEFPFRSQWDCKMACEQNWGEIEYISAVGLGS
jgi:hypothetical protein